MNRKQQNNNHKFHQELKPVQKISKGMLCKKHAHRHVCFSTNISKNKLKNKLSRLYQVMIPLNVSNVS